MSTDGWDVSRGPHRPLHWYEDAGCYWITGATLYRRPRFADDARKQRFVDEMYAAAEQWGVELVGWTLMEQHYHAILYPEQGRSLPRFLGRLHGRTAAFVNEQDRTPGRQVWCQYWDTLLRSQGDFWSRMAYMWWNPVKHGYCRSPEEWPWTNLHAVMMHPDDHARQALQRFPAPRKLPGDDW